MTDVNYACIRSRAALRLGRHNGNVSFANVSSIGVNVLRYDASSLCSKFLHSATSKTRAAVNCVEWFSNGRRVITGNQVGEFTMWNGAHFGFDNLMQAHASPVRCLFWMPPDSFCLLSGDAGGVIKFWDQGLVPFVQFQAHKESIREIAASASGSKIFTAADEPAGKIWDYRTGVEERLLTGHSWDVRTAHWHPEMSLIATGSKDSTIKLWDPRAAQAVCTLYVHKSIVTKVRWSPDGKYLLTGSRDTVIKMLDVRTMADRVQFKKHSKEVTCLAWHPTDRSVFVSGSYDGEICHWDISRAESEVLASSFGSGVGAGSGSGIGVSRLGAASSSGSTFVSEPVESLPQSHDQAVWGFAFHPLGHMAVSVSQDNCTKFWGRQSPGDDAPQARAAFRPRAAQGGGMVGNQSVSFAPAGSGVGAASGAGVAASGLSG